MKNTTSTLLNAEFEKRKIKNPLYSIRAFARDLSIGKTTMHELLSGVRKISKSTCLKISKNLELDQELENKIIYENTILCGDDNYQKLALSEFETIATCQHYALLSLSKLPNCPSDNLALAKRISLSPSQTKKIKKDLLTLKLIEEYGENLSRTSKPITTTHDIPSEAIKNYHHSSLDMVKSALNEIEVDLRDITSSTFAMSPSNIGILKEEIKKLKRKLIKKVENTNEHSEVFQMNISVIPLSKRT